MKRSLAQAFAEFDRDNPLVWELFKRFTLEVIQSGYPNFGVGAIYERMRWEAKIIIKTDDFKLNNNHRAFYARKFMDAYPEHEGFFRTRVSVADRSIISQ